MPVYAHHDLVIHPVGSDLMYLFDAVTGEQIVTATRMNSAWVVHAEGIIDATVDNRPEAVKAMQTHALAILPKDGYSTLVPFGLKQMP